MDQLLHPAGLGKIKKGRGGFNIHSAPEQLRNGIIAMQVKIGSWQVCQAARANGILVFQQYIIAGIANLWKKQTDEIVDQ
jgi:hypothetical protein